MILSDRENREGNENYEKDGGVGGVAGKDAGGKGDTVDGGSGRGTGSGGGKVDQQTKEEREKADGESGNSSAFAPSTERNLLEMQLSTPLFTVEEMRSIVSQLVEVNWDSSPFYNFHLSPNWHLYYFWGSIAFHVQLLYKFNSLPFRHGNENIYLYEYDLCDHGL